MFALKNKTYEEIYGVEEANNQRKKRSEIGKEIWTCLEVKRKHSDGARKGWGKLGVKEKVCGKNNCMKRSEVKEKHKKAVNELEFKERAREMQIKRWQNPEIRKRMIEALNRPDVKKKMSDTHSKLWQDLEYAEKIIKATLKACQFSPNKAELKLNSFLQQVLPNEYKYVGLGEFILAGKCPDFVNINGQKKLIELYGDYWHQGETGEDRKALFRKYGYQTLIVWEHELGNEKTLRNKVLRFNNDQKI